MRELVPEDLGVLREKRERTLVQKFRDSHHKLAWLAATGMRREQMAVATGYSISRLNILTSDPAFRELVAEKRGMVEDHRAEVLDDYQELIRNNMIKAERQIADKLDDADENDELLPTRDLIAISRDAADRLGHGKKSTTVNVNVDFAAKLDRAMQRSSKVIEHEPAQALPPVARRLESVAVKAPVASSMAPSPASSLRSAASPGLQAEQGNIQRRRVA